MGSEALPAENQNNMRIWGAAQASVDIAARRNSAGPIVARRKTGGRRAQVAECGLACGKIATPRKATSRAPRVAGEQDVGRRRAATKRDVSGGESEERFANVERGACIFGHCGATQQCGPHRRTPQAWSEARASRGMWNGMRQDRNVAQGNLSRRRGRRVSKTWGDGGRRGIEAILHSWSMHCFLVISFAAPIDR